jgi:hypothetical protein
MQEPASASYHVTRLSIRLSQVPSLFSEGIETDTPVLTPSSWKDRIKLAWASCEKLLLSLFQRRAADKPSRVQRFARAEIE